jgi:anthranilate phosphoribosyltransferase
MASALPRAGWWSPGGERRRGGRPVAHGIGAAMSEVVRAALSAVVEGETLSLGQARDAMGAVMDGEATPAQLGALLVALRMRGETVDELAGFATAMRERVLRVDAPDGAIDVVGTGGDRSGTFNISTAAAIVVAAAGVPVAKHGNRAITSASGSSDVLDALGIVIQQSPDEAAASLREDGFAFLFAPAFHPAMMHAGPTRREIGVRTAFNLIGPMTNPAGVSRLVVGAGDARVAPKMADVLQRLGIERAFVVHGEGIDELPLDGSGVRYDVTPGAVTQSEILPESVGLARAPRATLAGGTPVENAAIVEAVLRGTAGPHRDVVLLNAGAALEVAGRAGSLGEGVAMAGQTIDSGAAADRLERLRARRTRVEGAREDTARDAAGASGAVSAS